MRRKGDAPPPESLLHCPSMGYRTVRINTAELSPTQATIGGFEVVLKADRFKLMSRSAVDGYLRDKESREKPVLVVKGLHRYFVVDGHHTLSAILKACAPRELDLSLRADFSQYSSKERFWEKMAKEGLVYDKCLGERVSPMDFPKAFLELRDDPYRSIAWLIRKMGAYDDLKQPYQEFRIADFLREHMAFTPVEYHEYETACLRAYELMRSSAAKEWAKSSKLPGFKPDPVAEDDLIELYYDVLTSARRPRYYR